MQAPNCGLHRERKGEGCSDLEGVAKEKFQGFCAKASVGEDWQSPPRNLRIWRFDYLLGATLTGLMYFLSVGHLKSGFSRNIQGLDLRHA
jgi:hypothetical protein